MTEATLIYGQLGIFYALAKLLVFAEPSWLHVIMLNVSGGALIAGALCFVMYGLHKIYTEFKCDD